MTCRTAASRPPRSGARSPATPQRRPPALRADCPNIDLTSPTRTPRRKAALQLHLTGLDTAHVQDVVDERQRNRPSRRLVQVAQQLVGLAACERASSSRPTMPLSGVRISWLILLRKSVLTSRVGRTGSRSCRAARPCARARSGHRRTTPGSRRRPTRARPCSEETAPSSPSAVKGSRTRAAHPVPSSTACLIERRGSRSIRRYRASMSSSMRSDGRRNSAGSSR